MFNATFTNISVILWLSVLLVKESGVPIETIDLSQVTDKLFISLDTFNVRLWSIQSTIMYSVLEMNIWIYRSESNSTIYFYIFLNKN